MAGAFIALGALFYTVTVTTGNEAAVPFGLLRLAGGVAFSLGLVLVVVVGGAGLFTGNNLIAMAWASGRVATQQIMRNWGWVYLGNLVGAVGTAALVWLAGIQSMGDGAVGETMVQIVRSKIALDPVSAVARGVFCNVLVCLAVWLCMGARSDSRHRLSDHRVCRLRIRTLRRQYVFLAGRHCAGSRWSSPAFSTWRLEQSCAGDDG